MNTRHFARSVDYISNEQAAAAINIVLEKSKNDANAAIAELWVYEQGQDVDVLRSYARVADAGIPNPQRIPLHDKATGFLVWIAEKKKALWLNDIQEGAKSGKYCLTNDLIDERYYNVYDRTRAFAGIPIIYRGRFRAIFTLEVTARNRLEQSLFRIF